MERRLGKNFLEKLKKDGYIDAKTGSGNDLLPFTLLPDLFYLDVSSFITQCYSQIFIGEIDFRVTEECMKERLNTNMHELCNLIDKECRYAPYNFVR